MTGDAPAARGYVAVAVVHPSLSHLDRTFTYAAPPDRALPVGTLVRVPFRGRNRPAVVIEQLAEPGVDRVLPVAAVLGPGLPDDIVELARWTAARYLATVGEALAAALPERVASEEKQPAHAPAAVPAAAEPGTLARARGGRALWRAAATGTPDAFVWRPSYDEARGETIASMAGAALARGAGVLILVPEIRVAGGVVTALRRRFGDAAAWLGSDRPARERYRDWLAVRAGVKRLAIGSRAAVFAPVEDLGLIVIDDEGHASYKEGRAPRFHARAVAAERAQRARCPIVLVGVPPSMEARAAVAAKRYRLVAPTRDDERRRRPPVIVIDRDPQEDRHTPTGRTLRLARTAHAAGGRIVVLVHRGGPEMAGIADRVTRALGARRPAILDAASGAAALARAVRDADVIVATPFVAKDLDVTGAGLLAILEPDAALSQPEFRAPEDALATWWHAARWAAGGRIVIETRDPRQPAIAALARWDPDVLWRAEAARRTELGYPPFSALARIDVPADRADAVAAEVAVDDRLEALGPVEREGRWVVVVRARRRDELLDALRPLADRWRAADEPMRVDVDPREVFVPKWRS